MPPPFYLDDNASTLKILHVTDIHTNLPRITQLVEWIIENKVIVNVILLSGDISNMHDEDYLDPARESAFEGDMSTVISALENININVFYIPGNHDPRSTFFKKPLPQLTSFSMNVHGRTVRIAKDLVLAGFGGSISSFQNNKVLWEGFPFKLDSDVTPQLQELLSLSQSSSVLQPTDSVILMTHFGPASVDTAIDTTEPASPIYTGSAGLRDILDTTLLNIPINLHGHTHNSPGRVLRGRTVVINPGSLSEARFGIYTLERNVNKGKWVLTTSSFYTLQ